MRSILLLLIILSFGTQTWATTLKYVSQYPKHRHVPWAKDNQGITHDENYWFISQRSHIWKIHKTIPLSSVTNTNHPLVKKIGIPRHLRKRKYNHFGDITFYDGLIYVPLEGKRPSRGRFPNILLTFDARTLRLVGEYTLPHSHVLFSWVAVNPIDKLIYTSEFSPMDKGGILAYKITGKKLKLVKRFMPIDRNNRNPKYIKRIQGGVFDERTNLLMLSCDHKKGGIIGLDMDTFVVKFRNQVNYAPGFPKYEELEGLTIWRNSNSPNVDGDVHLMMLDNDYNDHDEIYIKHYDIIGKFLY